MDYLPYQDDRAMAGLENAMTPISRTVQGPEIQPTSVATPWISALFGEGGSCVESSFSEPISST